MTTVVINSCASYADQTLPPLLESLRVAGVPSERVCVVIGDCEADRDATKDDVKVYERRYAMLDNNGLAWACLEPHQLQGTDWIVYLHDTCAVDPDFWKACSFLTASFTNVDCVRLVPRDSMGMGFYRVAWLHTPAVVLRMEDLKTYDTAGRVHLKQRLDILEDTLFKLASAGAGKLMTLADGFQCTDISRVYGPACEPRRVESYFPPGIHKFKANWGQETYLKVSL